MRPTTRKYPDRSTSVPTIPELAVVALAAWILVVHKQHLFLGARKMNLNSGCASSRFDVPRDKVTLSLAFETLARAGPKLRKVEIKKFSFKEETNDELAPQSAPEHDRSTSAHI